MYVRVCRMKRPTAKEVESARRILKREEDAVRLARRMKLGDVRYLQYDVILEAHIYAVKPWNGTPPSRMERAIAALPEVAVGKVQP